MNISYLRTHSENKEYFLGAKEKQNKRKNRYTQEICLYLQKYVVNPQWPKAPQEMTKKNSCFPKESLWYTTLNKHPQNCLNRNFLKTLYDISTHAQQVNNLYLSRIVTEATAEQEECSCSLCFIFPLKKKQSRQRGAEGVESRTKTVSMCFCEWMR